MAYNNKWTPEFPASVGNALRPNDPIDNTEDYQTDGFPQFIANDPVRYDLQNAVLKQVLSNDERLNEKISVTNLAHNTDPKAHATGIAGNAATATKLASQKNIALTGDATGSVSFDGSGDVNINATLATVPIAKGGTGAITPAGALVNFDLTATATELNYVDGVTSSVQTQLNAKAPIVSPIFTGTVTAPSITSDSWNMPTYGGGFFMQDTTWIRAQNNKSIYTQGKIQADGGFNGNLNGTANNANTAAGLYISSGRNNIANQIVRTDGNGYLQTGYINSSGGDEGNNSNPARVWGTNGSDSYLRTYLTSALSVHQSSYTENVANDNTYMRFHWAGQGGQPTWLWGGNDAGNMYVYNPSNFNVNYANGAGNVNGYTADALRNRIGGRNTPVLTPLIDWSKAQEVGTNSGAGLTGQGGGDIYLKQSYKNFDKILVHGMDDGAEWSWSQIFEKWELDYAFGNTYRFILARSGDSCWILWSGVNLGTSTHPLSTETCWKQQTQNCRIKEIYGLTY